MKFRNVITLGVAATASFTFAQQNAAPLKAYVQFEKGRPSIIAPTRANGKNSFVYVVQEQEMQGNAAKCKLFFIQTPVDLAAAEKSLRDGDFAAARKSLAAVKTKYAAWQGLPGDPSTKAALLELECAIRQLDWEALRGLVSRFPHADWLEGTDVVTMEVARVLSGITDDAAAAAVVKTKAEELIKKRAAVLDSRSYGYLKYAIARAEAAGIPAAEVEGSISDANKAKANAAIDLYCQAGISSHGSQMEVPVDAMRRAQALLWAMPGVKDYANRIGTMDKKKWSDAPADFRDAVALAYMLKNVFAPDLKDAGIEKAAKYFFNTKAPEK